MPTCLDAAFGMVDGGMGGGAIVAVEAAAIVDRVQIPSQYSKVRLDNSSVGMEQGIDA